MGDKATARETMRKAGVPTVPGSEGLIEVSQIMRLIWLYFVARLSSIFSLISV